MCVSYRFGMVVEFRPCPRCRATTFAVGGDGRLRGVLSRTSRDDGTLILVCARCSQRESLYGDDPATPPITQWPLPPERLAQEEERLIRQMHGPTGDVPSLTSSPRADDAAGLNDR